MPRATIKDPLAWMSLEISETIAKNSNAIHWLQNHIRDPFPDKLIWDTATTIPQHASEAIRYLDTPQAKDQIGHHSRLFYWLDLTNNPPQKELGQIIASYSQKGNRIDIETMRTEMNLKLLLNSLMVDFSKPVVVFLNGIALWNTCVSPNLKTMTRTLLERGDPNLSFQAEITLATCVSTSCI